VLAHADQLQIFLGVELVEQGLRRNLPDAGLGGADEVLQAHGLFGSEGVVPEECSREGAKEGG